MAWSRILNGATLSKNSSSSKQQDMVSLYCQVSITSLLNAEQERRKDEKVNTMYITDGCALRIRKAHGEDRRKREKMHSGTGLPSHIRTYLKTEPVPGLGYLVHLRLRWMHSQGPWFIILIVKRHDCDILEESISPPATAPKSTKVIHKQPLGLTHF